MIPRSPNLDGIITEKEVKNYLTASFADNKESGGSTMKETFLTQFSNKADKVRKKGSDCFKTADYIGFIQAYLEAGYYGTLAYAVNGDNHEAHKDGDGKTVTVIDNLKFSLKVNQPSQGRITQALKKMGKLEKLPEIETAIERFIDEVSADFTVLSEKSTEIYNTLMNMGTWEKVEKGLTHNVNNEIDAEDKLFLEDNAVMTVMNRLKAPGIINRLKKEIQGILQKIP